MGIRQSEQIVKSEFRTDAAGNPTGGTSYAYLVDADGGELLVIDIDWQDGIVGDGGQNGAFVEDVLEVARQRLQFFQGSKFRCRENAIALTHIETALAWLDFRTRGRLVQGVENTYDEHVS
jgi:hypothetical protein